MDTFDDNCGWKIKVRDSLISGSDAYLNGDSIKPSGMGLKQEDA